MAFYGENEGKYKCYFLIYYSIVTVYVRLLYHYECFVHNKDSERKAMSKLAESASLPVGIA